MADNRLLIRDTETGDEFVLARSMSKGWWLAKGFSKADFETWMENRDPCSYGQHDAPTTLELVLEITPQMSEEAARWTEEVMREHASEEQGPAPSDGDRRASS